MTAIPHRQLRAPQEDGTALIDPPLSQVRELIAVNRARLAEFDRVSGFPAGYRASVRAGVSPDVPLILTGHQPELFHPGVWFKNFLASSIAQHVGGRAVNLVIDSDLVRTTSIRVPTGQHEPEVVDVPFDLRAPEAIWESRTIENDDVFQQFGAAVAATIGPQYRRNGGKKGLVLGRLWPHALAIVAEERPVNQAFVVENAAFGILPPGFVLKSANLGKVLAVARHATQREYGLTTEECLISDEYVQRAFSGFVLRLLMSCEHLRDVHNAALSEYRIRNRIRSASRPVPDLSREGAWTELPLWFMHLYDRPVRRRAFARRLDKDWEISDRSEIHHRVPQAFIDRPSEFFAELEDANVCLRPRALLTTMFARLVLSDLFIHGIGGAKYDEVTDEIIRRFFGIEPPAYITATATFRLPIDRPQVSIDDVRAAAQRIRDVRYRPESLLSEPAVQGDRHLAQQLTALASEKREYVRSHGLRRGLEATYRGLARINAAMHDRLREIEAQLRAEHAQLVKDFHRSQLLGSREFSFVLYPEDYLVPRLLELSKISA